MIASGFSWFRLIPAIDHDTLLHSMGIAEHSLDPSTGVANSAVYAHAWLTVAVLLLVAAWGRVLLNRAKARSGIEKYFADDRPTILSLVEVYALGIKSMMGDLLNKVDTRYYFPLIAALFAYIFVNNIQGILPGFLPATDNINTNVGMAIIVFLTFNAVGLYRDAGGYLKHLMGPVLPLAILLFPIEVISLFIRPISLTIRLTANMFGDHQVFTIMSDLVPVILPVGLLSLAVLVSVIQAFVFSLLTIIYINLSLPHHEHEAH